MTAIHNRQRTSAGRLAVLEAEVATLPSKPIAQLRSLWAQHHGGQTPSVSSRQILVRLLAWDLQAEVLGGLDPRTAQKLARIADTVDHGRPCHSTVTRASPVGTVLSRQWRGVVHTAVVTASGVEYDGKTYRSLSDVARTITGTRWSGPRFFGLEHKSASGKPKP